MAVSSKDIIIMKIDTESRVYEYEKDPEDTKKKKLLGEGGFGKVYSAIDRKNNQKIAIKEIDNGDKREPKQIKLTHNGRSTLALREKWKEDYEKIRHNPKITDDIMEVLGEMDLHSTLKHKNIVIYYGHLYENGIYKIFMEQISGGTLSELVSSNWGPLGEKPETFCFYMKQLLNGISYLHNKDIIHRDIKGTNILIDTETEILKISDFGTCKLYSEQLAAKTCTGTYHFMAPEVITAKTKNHGYDTKVDIWSVGCTAVEMLTGNPPFYQLEPVTVIFRVGWGRVTPEILQARDLTPDMMDFLTKCFQKDPTVRASAGKLLAHPLLGEVQTKEVDSNENTQVAITITPSLGPTPTNQSYGSDLSVASTIPYHIVKFVNHSFRSGTIDEQEPNKNDISRPEKTDDVNTGQAQETVVLNKNDYILDTVTPDDAPRNFLKAVPSSTNFTTILESPHVTEDLMGIVGMTLKCPTLQEGASAEYRAFVTENTTQLLKTIEVDNPDSVLKEESLRWLIIDVKEQLTYIAKREDFNSLLVYEKELHASLQEMQKEVPPVALLRIQAYAWVVQAIYILLLAEKIKWEDTEQMRSHKEYSMKYIEKYMNNRGKYGQIYETKLQILWRYINRCLMGRLKDKPSIRVYIPGLPKMARFAAHEYKEAPLLLQNIIFYCQDVEEGHGKEEKEKEFADKLASKEIRITERYLFLLFLSLQVPKIPGLSRLVLKIIAKMSSERMPFWGFGSIVYLLVELLLHTDDQELCDKLLHEKREGLGLIGFLQAVLSNKENRTKDFKPIAVELCCPLLMHPLIPVHQAVMSLPIEMIQHEVKVKDYFKEHISKSLCLYKCKIKESFKCMDCELLQEPFHFSWEGHFGKTKEIKVLIHVAKPSMAITDNESENESARKITDEIDILSELMSKGNCQDIIKMVAFQNTHVPIYYVFERPNQTKTLATYLQELQRRKEQSSIRELIKNAVLPMLRAIEYCHTCSVIVRNVTASSFLVTNMSQDRHSVKLYAFHLARIGEKSEESNQICFHGDPTDKIPTLWSPQESLLERLYTPSSDSYMAAQTILEILTLGKHPFSEIEGKTAQEKILQVLCHGIYPGKPPSVPTVVYEIAISSLSHSPEKRSPVTTLYQKIEQYLKELQPKSPLRGTYPKMRIRQQHIKVPEMGIPQSFNEIKDLNELLENQNEMLMKFEALKHFQGKGNVHQNDDILCTEDELKALDDPKLEKLKLKASVLRTLDGNFQNFLNKLDHEHVAKLQCKHRNIHGEENQLYIEATLPTALNLKDFILRQKPAKLTSEDLLGYMRQVAMAIVHLHAKAVVIGFVKAEHSYMNEDQKSVTLSYFARSCKLEVGPYDHDITQVVMTPFTKEKQARMKNAVRWSAMEVNHSGTYSVHSDTANFAHFMWELVALNNLSPNANNMSAIPYANIKLEEVLSCQRGKQMLPQLEGCPDWLHILWRKCVLDPAYRRPLMKDVLDCLSCSDPSQHPLIRDTNPDDPLYLDDELYNYYSIGNIEYNMIMKKEIAKEAKSLKAEFLLKFGAKSKSLESDTNSSDAGPSDNSYNNLESVHSGGVSKDDNSIDDIRDRSEYSYAYNDLTPISHIAKARKGDTRSCEATFFPPEMPTESQPQLYDDIIGPVMPTESRPQVPGDTALPKLKKRKSLVKKMKSLKRLFHKKKYGKISDDYPESESNFTDDYMEVDYDRCEPLENRENVYYESQESSSYLVDTFESSEDDEAAYENIASVLQLNRDTGYRYRNDCDTSFENEDAFNDSFLPRVSSEPNMASLHVYDEPEHIRPRVSETPNCGEKDDETGLATLQLGEENTAALLSQPTADSGDTSTNLTYRNVEKHFFEDK